MFIIVVMILSLVAVLFGRLSQEVRYKRSEWLLAKDDPMSTMMICVGAALFIICAARILLGSEKWQSFMRGLWHFILILLELAGYLLMISGAVSAVNGLGIWWGSTLYEKEWGSIFRKDEALGAKVAILGCLTFIIGAAAYGIVYWWYLPPEEPEPKYRGI